MKTSPSNMCNTDPALSSELAQNVQAIIRDIRIIIAKVDEFQLSFNLGYKRTLLENESQASKPSCAPTPITTTDERTAP